MDSRTAEKRKFGVGLHLTIPNKRPRGSATKDVNDPPSEDPGPAQTDGVRLARRGHAAVVQCQERHVGSTPHPGWHRPLVVGLATRGIFHGGKPPPGACRHRVQRAACRRQQFSSAGAALLHHCHPPAAPGDADTADSTQPLPSPFPAGMFVLLRLFQVSGTACFQSRLRARSQVKRCPGWGAPAASRHGEPASVGVAGRTDLNLTSSQDVYKAG